jgi:hypothetical protein
MLYAATVTGEAVRPLRVRRLWSSHACSGVVFAFSIAFTCAGCMYNPFAGMSQSGVCAVEGTDAKVTFDEWAKAAGSSAIGEHGEWPFHPGYTENFDALYAATGCNEECMFEWMSHQLDCFSSTLYDPGCTSLTAPACIPPATPSIAPQAAPINLVTLPQDSPKVNFATDPRRKKRRPAISSDDDTSYTSTEDSTSESYSTTRTKPSYENESSSTGSSSSGLSSGTPPASPSSTSSSYNPSSDTSPPKPSTSAPASSLVYFTITSIIALALSFELLDMTVPNVLDW